VSNDQSRGRDLAAGQYLGTRPALAASTQRAALLPLSAWLSVVASPARALGRPRVASGRGDAVKDAVFVPQVSPAASGTCSWWDLQVRLERAHARGALLSKKCGAACLYCRLPPALPPSTGRWHYRPARSKPFAQFLVVGPAAAPILFAPPPGYAALRPAARAWGAAPPAPRT
jgi:hypothetical protein